MEESNPYGGPWYVHFWPWFIVLLLSTTVVAGIYTVVIAVAGADSIVVDDYYKKGKAINLALEGDREAELREVHARVHFGDGIEIDLALLGERPARLQLDLSHVTRAEFDTRFELERVTGDRYATTSAAPIGRYYATLRPAGEGASWRLRRRLSLPADGPFEMDPSG